MIEMKNDNIIILKLKNHIEKKNLKILITKMKNNVGNNKIILSKS